MKLALFDLDHTLIPFDSGMAWTRFLVDRGVLPAQAEGDYLGWCHAYVAGTLDIHTMHRASVGLLREVEPGQLETWLNGFEHELRRLGSCRRTPNRTIRPPAGRSNASSRR